MDDRAVLAPQPCGVTLERLALGEAAQDVVEHVPVGVELRDVVPDVLLGRVAQHVELRAVGAQDGAVGADQVDADRGVVEKLLGCSRRGKA